MPVSGALTSIGHGFELIGDLFVRAGRIMAEKPSADTPSPLSLIDELRAAAAEYGPAPKIERRHEPYCFATSFISDTHFGTDECQAQALLGFVNHAYVQHSILGGDIFDPHAMGIDGTEKLGLILNSDRFTSEQMAVLPYMLGKKFLKDKKAYTTFMPGNHDIVFLPGKNMEFRLRFGGHKTRIILIPSDRSILDQMPDGRIILDEHSDKHDMSLYTGRELAALGTNAYHGIVRPVSHAIQRFRGGHPAFHRFLNQAGLERCSLADAIRNRVEPPTRNAQYRAAVREHVRRCNMALPLRKQISAYFSGHTHQFVLGFMGEEDGAPLLNRRGEPVMEANAGHWTAPPEKGGCTAIVVTGDNSKRKGEWIGEVPPSTVMIVGWDDKRGIVPRKFEPQRRELGKRIAHIYGFELAA
ncbi:MAG: hypothetical protein WDO70_02745 [Alphaproteobacteria bacterium]